MPGGIKDSITDAQEQGSLVGVVGGQEPPAPYSIGGSVYKEELPITVVGCGVDTLYQNYSLGADLLASWELKLEAWKLAAQEANERYRLPVGGGLLFIAPKGRGHYGYVVECPGVGELMVSYNKLFAAHPVRVRLSAEFAAGASSFDDLEQGALGLVERLFGQGTTSATQVSELHIAADFVGYVPTMRDLQARRFVCPSAPALDECDADFQVINSMHWGKHGAPISAVLYNKHKEIREQSQHKRFLLDKWRLAGWSEEQGEVYRLEFRFSREWLRERGVNGPADVDLAALLASGMDWLELRDPAATDTNRARWLVSSVWTAIEGQASAMLQGVWLPLHRDYVPNVTIDQLAAQIGGCVACLGALVNHDDLGDLFAVAFGLYEQKLERTGQNLGELVQKRRDRYMLTDAA